MSDPLLAGILGAATSIAIQAAWLRRKTRKRRNAAPHGSEEHRAAIDLIGRIEVEVARIERAMDPPRG